MTSLEKLISTGQSQITVATPLNPFELQSRQILSEVVLEVQSWGKPNEDFSNAILVCHSFSADAHAAGIDTQATVEHRPWRIGNPGWWDNLIGEGKALDTSKYWVVCSNVLGGSGGSTGPNSIDPNGQIWGDGFPELTIDDIVNAQVRLSDLLGVPRWKLVVGGSLGGLQTLEWALGHPDRLDSWCAIACSARASLAGIQHFAAGIHYIERERDTGGDGTQALLHAFGTARRFSGPAEGAKVGDDWVGQWPVSRYHPLTYQRLAKALIRFDLANTYGDGDLVRACARIRAPGILVAFPEDDLFTPSDAAQLHSACREAGAKVKLAVIPGPAGHDSFLVQPTLVNDVLAQILG